MVNSLPCEQIVQWHRHIDRNRVWILPLSHKVHHLGHILVECKTPSGAQCMLEMAFCVFHVVVVGKKVEYAGDRPNLVKQDPSTLSE